MSKRALIVIDIQNDYFPGGKWVLHNINNAADNAAHILEAARQSNELIVHVRHEFPTSEAPFFAPGTPGADIHDRVKPVDGEAVITKQQINSFRDTNLKSILDENGISEVTLVGAMSHMCIDAAARAAADYGYSVNVIEDACASRDLEFQGRTVPAVEVHAAYMSALGFAYANVSTTQEYLSVAAAA